MSCAVCKAGLGLQQAEKTEQVKQEQAQQWLHTQSDRGSERWGTQWRSYNKVVYFINTVALDLHLIKL